MTFALALVAVARAPASSRGDVVVLSSDPVSVVVEFTPQWLPAVPRPVPGGTSLQFDFEGGGAPPEIRPGSPYISVRTVPLLVGTGGHRVEILDAEYSDTSGVLLAPAPDLAGGGDVPSWIHRPDPALYGTTGFLPADIAVLTDVGAVRGTILGNLVIAPLRYDPASRVLRRYSRIVVRVSSDAPAPGRPGADPMAAGIAVNDPRGQEPSPVSGRQGRTGDATRTTRLAGSVLAQGAWLKLSVTEEGIYRLTGQMLAGAGVPASTDPRSIRVFGNGGAELPLNPLAPVADDLVEVARIVNDAGSPGVLDPSDEVIFYATATRGWKYDPASGRLSHTVNRFWETSYYWITYGGAPGRPMPVLGAAPAADYAAGSVEGKLFREDDRQNILASGLSWLGQSFNAGDRLTYAHQLPGLIAGSTIRYRFRFGSRASSTSSFVVSDHGLQLGTAVTVPGTVVGSYFHDQVLFSTADRAATVSWGDGQSLLNIAYASGSSAGTGYLDWYEVFYERRTVVQADRISFHMPDTGAVIEYRVTGFSGTAVRAFDVSAHDSPALIVTDNHSDTCAFRAAGTPGARRHIALAGPNGYLTPAAIVPVPNQDLHGDPGVADMIIVAHPSLLGAANRLKAFRERPGPSYLAVRVVNVEHIYNEFGGGIPSPVAIRNYFKYAVQTQTPPPRYALLLGDGDYDYRRAVASGPMLMPPWETEATFRPIDTYASDDYFALVDGSERVQLALGRLTAQNASEASTMVDKIIEYETAPVMDTWKTLVTFVADDGLAAAGDDDRFLHLQHGENVANVLPDLFDREKIYLFDYPTEIAAAGRRKPGVNKAIRDAINRGTLVLNFSGHGNPRLWTHEAVFVREDDIPLLTNKGKYFILIAATCNYAYFDAIADQSGAEILTAKPGAGAIAGLSATRVVYAFQNLRMNSTFFSYLFEEDSLGRMVTQRLGDAMFRTKQVLTGSNDEKYFILGDPALIPAFPKRFVVVDSVNHRPADQVVDLYALGLSSVSARIAPDAGAPAWSGSARVSVYDADRLVTINDPTAGTYRYRASGNILFRGEATAALDRLAADFIVPKDISYGEENGRIAIYTWNQSTDGSGYTRNIRIAGTDTTAPPDAHGPVLSLYLDSRDFRPGDEVSSSPTLIVDIADSSGVNTSRAGIGHGLEAWIDDQPAGIDLSDSYRSRPDTYREGVVTHALGPLPAGTHRIRMRAWDTWNNSSTGETVFSVGGAGGLRLANVYNYPNPFSRATNFTFEHNQTSPVDVEVKIYTVAGRLINSVEGRGFGERFVKLPWDGRDREGDELANGVYLYKVIARTVDGKYSGEALGKLSVTR